MNIEVPERGITFQSFAKMSYEYPSMNATEKHVLELYDLGVKNAVFVALRKIKGEMTK